MAEILDSNSEFDLVMEGIGLLLKWRQISPFHARVLSRSADEPERESMVDVWPLDGSYRVVETDSGRWFTYNWHTRQAQQSDGESFTYTPNLLMFGPRQVRLAFPLDLPVWNRSNLDYRIVGAEQSPGILVLKLRHNSDAALTGTLTIDLDRRRAIRIETPTESCRYEDIRSIRERSEDL